MHSRSMLEEYCADAWSRTSSLYVQYANKSGPPLRHQNFGCALPGSIDHHMGRRQEEMRE
jgi:hypothetical protein